MKWPYDIVRQLVRFTNPGGTTTNSDLELAALVLHEAVFRSISASLAWRTPTLGSDNTPAFTCTFREDFPINPVVANLFSIRSAQNRLQHLTPSAFYHPGQLNTMADDDSHCFDLPTHPFLELFHSKYSPHSPGLWTICHLSIVFLLSDLCAVNKYSRSIVLHV